jgi:hypothetical protein
MFVGREVSLNLGFAVARARLAALTAGAWLREVSGQAFAEGYADLAHLGPPAGGGGVPQLARVQFLPPQRHDQIMIVPLRWEVAGRTGGLLPVLDADIVLLPAGECTRLTVSGSYCPPVEWFGATADKSVIREVAAATFTALLHKIATQLCPGEQPAGQRRPASPQGDGEGSRSTGPDQM